MNKIYLLILILLATCSCGILAKKQKTETIQIVRDSSVYRETVKLDTLFVPADKVQDTISINLLRALGKLSLNSGRAKTTVYLQDTNIIVSSSCDSLMLQYMSQLIQSHTQSSKENTQVSETSTKVWDWKSWAILVGLGLLLIIVQLIIYRNVKS